MNTEAIILAGGFGTRLQSVISEVPKPMAPVAGKPFLYYLLNYLQKEGIKRVVLSVGYKHETISDYFSSQFQNIELDYAIEEAPLGTGGGIINALKKCKEKQIFIVNGDTFFPIPLKKLDLFHAQKQAETSIALKPIENSDRYGTVLLNKNSFITSFQEKNKSQEALINGGIYLVDRKKLEARHFNTKFSFEKEYLEPAANENCIAGQIYNYYFLDIGIPASYQQAQTEMLQFL